MAESLPASLLDEIRTMLAKHGRLGVEAGALGPEDDLYDAGLDSHASVTLMLALEEHFDIEFPERLLRRKTFSSVAAIGRAISELRAEQE